MSKTQHVYDKSFLLAFTNEMSLAEGYQDLASIIFETLKERLLITGFIIHKPGGQHLLYEDVYPAPKKGSWLGFSERFIQAEDQLDRSPVDEPLILKTGEIEAGSGIRMAVGAGLKLRDKRMGVLWLFYNRELLLRKNHHKLLNDISAQIAIVFSLRPVAGTTIDTLANEKIAQQLKEINLYKQQLEQEKLYLQQEVSGAYAFSEIIGSGPQMEEVYVQIAQVASANSTVLILGETGTGKELIARAIHNSSKRKDKLMVKVNCASIPENLIESELFGHEKGAFTGAIERRIGKFELANKGTLFLDEIGEMPMELQVKLLRAIQEKEIERIGGKSVIKVDVRIIAATNRDLLMEVQQGNFRSDLYYRLNVFPITLPPLRDRKDDIPLLATHFINRFARNTGKNVNKISANAMKDLMAYDWPGNVRELEHLLERSILISKTDVIKEVHLPTERGNTQTASPEETYIKTSAENERDHILFVLKKCKGKIYGRGGAAELLDMHISTLNSRIKKLGIRKEHIFLVSG